jgi:hypothetical protein
MIKDEREDARTHAAAHCTSWLADECELLPLLLLVNKIFYYHDDIVIYYVAVGCGWQYLALKQAKMSQKLKMVETYHKTLMHISSAACGVVGVWNSCNSLLIDDCVRAC